MSKLETLIQQLCPDGVECRNLEECCNILDKKRKPVTKAAREAGEYRYYGANGIQDYVSDYIFDGTFVLVGEDGSVITKAGTPVVTWAEGKIWVNNHAHIIEEKTGVLLRYLFHYIQTIDVTSLIHGNIPKLTGGDLKTLKILIPPLQIQREIVRILDDFTDLIDELTVKLSAELTARKKQYEYYKRQLLDDLDAEDIPLNKACYNIFSGKNKVRLTDGKYPVYGSTGIISTTNIPVYNKEQILIARVGANAGFVHIANGEYDVSDNTLIVDLKDGVSLKYIYYQLLSMNLHQYAKGGGQPLVTAGQIKELKIIIPSLEKQLEIVSILDRFDALYNDLTSGLLAEIAARQKQYEYYRDKLLTFPEYTKQR